MIWSDVVAAVGFGLYSDGYIGANYICVWGLAMGRIYGEVFFYRSFLVVI